MLSRLRTHIGTAGLVVAIMALVVALAGGAIAATGGGSSPTAAAAKKKNKKAKAKRGPRGPRGKAGAQGPAGPQGPAGKDGSNGQNGADGQNGTPGTPGQNGASVTVTELESPECNNGEGGAKFTVGSQVSEACDGHNGLPGAPGEKGEPWTPDNVLPSGATETGVWSFAGGVAGSAIAIPVSFSIPLEDKITGGAHNIVNGFGYVGTPLTQAEKETLEGEGKTPAEINAIESERARCPGTAADPKAAEGNFCLYQNTAISGYNKPIVQNIGTSGNSLLVIVTTNAAQGSGSWAVTAP